MLRIELDDLKNNKELKISEIENKDLILSEIENKELLYDIENKDILIDELQDEHKIIIENKNLLNKNLLNKNNELQVIVDNLEREICMLEQNKQCILSSDE